MSQPAIRAVLRSAASATGAADAELLERFAAIRDESAFELLVWRHAALVQRVCMAVLGDHHAAEDAAQAAFLVLARKAHTFAGRGSVVGWLYRIARRVAVRAAKTRARRQVTSAELDLLPDARSEPEVTSDEVAALCAEVDRLPERYRVPVLLCFFEGLTHAEAARRIGWPVGSVAGRLARAKELLARRLSKKGVGVAAVMLGVPAGSFVGTTAQAAVAFAAPVAGAVVLGVESSVLQLAEGTLKTMTTFTWKLTAAAAALVVAVSAVTAGVIGLTHVPVPVPPVEPPTVPIAAPVPKQPAAGRMADAKQRARSQNNLKQILIAIHGYHDANGNFPQNVTTKDGKPLLSWRVLLLPYLEQEELYKQFKLDEPWDSENNKKLIAKMPSTYRVGFEEKGETKTYYQGFAGASAVFDPSKKITLVNITDGTSNTLAVVEAGPPVEWTKPEDIPYDPKNALPKLDGPFTNTLIVGAADGMAYALRRDIDEKTMRKLIEVSDGEIVSFDDVRGKFPLTAEDLKAVQELIKDNEKLIGEFAEELKQQQKLFADAIKKPNAKVDLEKLTRLNRDFRLGLAALKRETESLKRELEGEPNPAEPSSVPPAVPTTPKK